MTQQALPNANNELKKRFRTLKLLSFSRKRFQASVFHLEKMGFKQMTSKATCCFKAQLTLEQGGG